MKMREQLVKYVELLFAGTTDTYEIQQEILQNTLDRYDDLIEQGKSPEAAYRLAISGIGDINEIINQPIFPAPMARITQPERANSNFKLLRAIAIDLYILSAVPLLFTDGSTLGLCITTAIVAVATAIMVYIGKNKEPKTAPVETVPTTPTRGNGYKIAKGIIWGGGICLYISVSMITGAWWITWLIFPMLGCIQGITTAIFDLKEAYKQ
jgi:hypothetical protein